MSEKPLLNKLQLLASSLGNRLFRNNNGLAWTGSQIKKLKDGSILIKNPRPIKFGLGTGTGDLIGGTQIKIRAEHVGRTFFVFTNYEIKTNNVRVTQERKAFHNMEKKKSHAFGKDVYLLGTINGRYQWLEAPSWDCDPVS